LYLYGIFIYLCVNQIVMRFITLSAEELDLVTRLEKTSSNHIVRLRCGLLKLSNQKRSMKEVAEIMEVKWLRVVKFFNAWNEAKDLKEKYSTLSIKKGRGAKVKLASVKEILPDLLKDNDRNLNRVLLVLTEEYQINVCKSILQNFLKSGGL